MNSQLWRRRPQWLEKSSSVELERRRTILLTEIMFHYGDDNDSSYNVAEDESKHSQCNYHAHQYNKLTEQTNLCAYETAGCRWLKKNLSLKQLVKHHNSLSISLPKTLRIRPSGCLRRSAFLSAMARCLFSPLCRRKTLEQRKHCG